MLSWSLGATSPTKMMPLGSLQTSFEDFERDQRDGKKNNFGIISWSKAHLTEIDGLEKKEECGMLNQEIWTLCVRPDWT